MKLLVDCSKFTGLDEVGGLSLRSAVSCLVSLQSSTHLNCVPLFVTKASYIAGQQAGGTVRHTRDGQCSPIWPIWGRQDHGSAG